MSFQKIIIIKETGVSEKHIREWIENKLINTNGLRNFARRNQSSAEGLPGQAVEILKQAYLIREEKRLGSINIELAHDRLIDAIKNSNSNWKSKK